MNHYRRILITLPSDARAEALLHQADEQLKQGNPQVLILQVLDTRSGFEADGPAANLPMECAARRIPAARKRLDLLLARHGLGWIETRIVCGEPEPMLRQCIQEWRPDLLVACASHWSSAAETLAAADGPDFLGIKCHGLLRRLGAAFGQMVDHTEHRPA